MKNGAERSKNFKIWKLASLFLLATDSTISGQPKSRTLLVDKFQRNYVRNFGEMSAINLGKIFRFLARRRAPMLKVGKFAKIRHKFVCLTISLWGKTSGCYFHLRRLSLSGPIDLIPGKIFWRKFRGNLAAISAERVAGRTDGWPSLARP